MGNYGVPQLRKRVIALARLGQDPGFPAPTHHAYGAPGASRESTLRLPLAPTVRESLAGLPEPHETSEGFPQGHALRSIGEGELQRIRSLGEGQTMRDLPLEFQHTSYQKRANRRVGDGMPTERRGGAPAGIRRLKGDEPSKAITSAATREFIHPDIDRPITLRECARLQGFPDDHVFAGTLSEQATLIGNAVPPNFGRTFGKWIGDSPGSPQSPDDPALGLLLEFSVSNGSSMSPRLSHVVRRVESRYALGTLPL